MSMVGSPAVQEAKDWKEETGWRQNEGKFSEETVGNWKNDDNISSNASITFNASIASLAYIASMTLSSPNKILNWEKAMESLCTNQELDLLAGTVGSKLKGVSHSSESLPRNIGGEIVRVDDPFLSLTGMMEWLSLDKSHERGNSPSLVEKKRG